MHKESLYRISAVTYAGSNVDCIFGRNQIESI